MFGISSETSVAPAAGSPTRAMLPGACVLGRLLSVSILIVTSVAQLAWRHRDTWLLTPFIPALTSSLQTLINTPLQSSEFHYSCQGLRNRVTTGCDPRATD